jgi:hypothetical protein
MKVGMTVATRSKCKFSVHDAGDILNINHCHFRMVFRWVFIPWLQRELDAYRDRVNNTAKRRDRNKVLPHGVPNLIYNTPEDFGALDFKVRHHVSSF